MKLPELPHPDIKTAMVRPENEPRRLWGAYYTAHLMRSYGKACADAALEAAAQVCEGFDACDPKHIAAAIRALKEKA